MEKESNSDDAQTCYDDKNVHSQMEPEELYLEDSSDDESDAYKALVQTELVTDDWQMPLDYLLAQEFSVSYETCLAINQAYQMIIEEFLHRIDLKLTENIERQKALEHELNSNVRRKQCTNILASKRSHPLTMYMIPYFKDKNGMSCPLNEDVMLKKSEPDPYVLPSKIWIKKENLMLVEAVRNNLLRQLLKPYLAKQDYFSEKILNEGLTDAQTAELQSKIKDVDMEIASKNKITDEDLLNSPRNADIDWLMISSLTFDGQRSPMECQLYWQNKLHPSINNSTWLKEEQKKLKRMVKYFGHDWNTIAMELGTFRTSFSCAHYYHSALNDEVMKRKWTTEEDAFLLTVVESCRVGSYIPWNHVTYFMEGRTRMQVLKHWAKSLDPSIKRGKWSELEDMMLIAAVEKYGSKDWNRIKDYVPGRTDVQCRDRWSNSLNVNTKIGHWTQEEDETLIKFMEIYGEGKWAKVANHLPGRTDSMISHRYKTLLKGKRTNYIKDCNSLSLRHQIIERRERLHKMIKERISEITASKVNFSVVDIIGKKILETTQDKVEKLRSNAFQQLAALKSEESHRDKRPRAAKSKIEKNVDEELIKLMKERITKRRTGRPRKYCYPELQDKLTCSESIYNKALNRLHSIFTSPDPDNCPSLALSSLMESSQSFTVPRIPFLPPAYSTMLGFKHLLHFKKKLITEVNKLWKMPVIPQQVTVYMSKETGSPLTAVLTNPKVLSDFQPRTNTELHVSKSHYREYFNSELDNFSDTELSYNQISQLINEILPPIRCTKEYNILKDQFLSLFVWPALISNIPPKLEESVLKKNVASDKKVRCYPCTKGKKFRCRYYKKKGQKRKNGQENAVSKAPADDTSKDGNTSQNQHENDAVENSDSQGPPKKRRQNNKRVWFTEEQLRPRSKRMTKRLLTSGDSFFVQ